SENQALCGRIHRHVGGLLDDVEAFEVDPHGVRGIGEPAVSEGVGCEQIAELIVPARLWDTENRNEAGSEYDYAKADQKHGEPLSPGQTGEATLQSIEEDRLIAPGVP